MLVMSRHAFHVVGLIVPPVGDLGSGPRSGLSVAAWEGHGSSPCSGSIDPYVDA